MDRFDEWMQLPQNSSIRTGSGMKPMFMWSNTRPKTAQKYRLLMNDTFSFYDGGPDLLQKHYVGLQDDKMIGYFHYNEYTLSTTEYLHYAGRYELLSAELNESMHVGATSVHCYNFSSPMKFGKLQEMFYDYLTNTYDFVEVVTPEDCEWSNATRDAFGNELKCSEIAKRKKKQTGFAMPHLLERTHKKYNSVLTPFCLNFPTLSGEPRFHHMIRWLGTKSNLPQFNNNIQRSDKLRQDLYDAGITEYL